MQLCQVLHCITMQCTNELQCSAVQCSAVQCSAVQCTVVFCRFGDQLLTLGRTALAGMTADAVHCKYILHTAHFTLHTAHCTLHSQHCTLHTPNCTYICSVLNIYCRLASATQLSAWGPGCNVVWCTLGFSEKFLDIVI